jgi:predicted nucleic acid-binding protein
MAGGASLIARPVGPASLIADASPLVALSLVDRLHWLPKIFGPVHVVGTVLQEVLTGQFDASESRIRAALDEAWLLPVEPDRSSPSRSALQQRPDWKLLDTGEADSILYAMTQSHLPTPPVLLMDERAGRSVCASLGLPVLGTAGLIVLAKERNLVTTAKPEFERLHQAGFWLAPEVVRMCLRRCGELA